MGKIVKNILRIIVLILLPGLVMGCENNLLSKIYEATTQPEYLLQEIYEVTKPEYVVEFTADPEKALVNEKIEFTDITKIKGVLSRDWDFNDDKDFSDAEGKRVTHVFDSSGIYSVRLQITTDSTTIESTPKSIYIQEEMTRYLITDNISLPWTKHCIPNEFETFEDAYGIIAADVDQNGIMDVVTSTDWSGTIIWWKNVYGDGSVWDKNIISPEIDSVLYLCAANINGNVDIFCSAYREDMVYWWKNLGESEDTGEYEWEGHILVHNFKRPATIIPVDIDNNGILDILASAAKGNKICWWNGVDLK